MAYKTIVSDLSDEELIEKVLQGETQLYAAIVGRYQQNVANLCYKICGTRLQVEEVVQEVFVELYAALPRFKFKAKLSTYIYRITVNVISKALGHESRITLPDEVASANLPSGENNVEQSIVKSEREQQLRKAIGTLKHEQRTALVLYTFNDFSYQDIADVMQVSLAKVESLIFRAKKNLHQILTNESQKSKKE